MDFKNRKKPHTVYALMLNGNPIYVGCCMDIKQREKSHRLSKTFDYLIVIKEFNNKNDALIAENAIIRFMGVFNEEFFLNSLFYDIVEKRKFMDFWFNTKKGSEVNNG